MSNVSSSYSHKELKPKLRFNGFSEEWVSCLLSDASYYLKERKRVMKSQFVSTENMCQNCSGIDQYIDSSVVEGIAFGKNDILIANIRPYLKKAWKATFSGVCSTDVLALHIKKALPDFIYRIIENDDFFAYVMSAAKGSKMPRGDKQHIMNYQIALPCVQEQQIISAFLRYLDLRVIKQRQLINSFKSYKRGLLSLVFNDKSPTHVLGDILQKGKAGGTPQSSNPSYYNGNIPFLSIADMTEQGKYIYSTEKHISEAGLQNSTAWLVPTDCLILSMYASYGLVSINKVPLATSQAMFNMIFEQSVNVEYIYYYLTYLATTDYYTKMVSTGTQPNLNAEKVRAIPLYIPPQDEQRYIVKLLQIYDSKLTKEEKILTQLQTSKVALLQQLFI